MGHRRSLAPRSAAKRAASLIALGLLLAVSAFPGSLKPGSRKEDTSWKNYYNAQGSYCVDYLSKWTSGKAFDGAGFFVKPAKSLAEIDVALFKDHRAGAALSDEVQIHLDSLKKFELAQNVQLLDRHETTISEGHPALFAKHSYYDPQNNATIVDEIIFSENAGMLFRLELTSPEDELARFHPLFQRLVNSFRFDCAPHLIPRDFGSVRTQKDGAAQPPRPVVGLPHSAAN